MFYYLAFTVCIINIIPLIILLIQQKYIIEFYKRNLQLVTNPILAYICFFILGNLFSINDSFGSEQRWLIMVSCTAMGTCVFDVIQVVYKLLKK